MNNKNLMITRNGVNGIPQYAEEEKEQLTPDSPGYANSVSMLRRAPAAQAAGTVEAKDFGSGIPDIPDIPEEPEKEFGSGPSTPAQQPATQRPVQSPPQQQARPAQQAQGRPAPQKPVQNTGAAAGAAKKPAQPAASAQKPAQPAAAANTGASRPAAPVRIRQNMNPDELCKAYMDMFKQSFGMDLSASICYENMRRMCEADLKTPENTLYFMENTYRVSTLLYLASNLPIVFVTSVLAEKNRKNILKYVTIEVENGSKPYQELRDLRIHRWGRKFENMAVNDAMTVTPGVTGLSDALVSEMISAFQDTCAKLRKFNKELTGIVAKFDDGALNDVTYIYSNWWYFLQGFENVPEMRTYVMAITDDTRKNLKI